MKLLFCLCVCVLSAAVSTRCRNSSSIVFDAQALLKNQKMALLVVLRGALALCFLMNFGTC